MHLYAVNTTFFLGPFEYKKARKGCKSILMGPMGTTASMFILHSLFEFGQQ
jgi:hypothetical protein